MSKNKIRNIHFLLWASMFIYLIFAPSFYSKFIIKNGKPVQIEPELPKQTNRISYSVDRLDSTVLDGQALFYLWGWAFLQDEPIQSHYQKFVVLKSDSDTYFFQAESFDRPDIPKAFPNLTYDILNSGFSIYISKDVIKQGSYQIGILFENKTSKEFYFVITNKEIVRTPNQLRIQIAGE